jgi:hypothetical protein
VLRPVLAPPTDKETWPGAAVEVIDAVATDALMAASAGACRGRATAAAVRTVITALRKNRCVLPATGAGVSNPWRGATLVGLSVVLYFMNFSLPRELSGSPLTGNRL